MVTTLEKEKKCMLCESENDASKMRGQNKINCSLNATKYKHHF